MDTKWIGGIGAGIGVLGLFAALAVAYSDLESNDRELRERANFGLERITRLERRIDSDMERLRTQLSRDNERIVTVLIDMMRSESECP